jgi:phosphoglycerol transferase
MRRETFQVWAIAAVAFAAAALLFRSVGLFPVVFADEWTYSSHARHLALEDAKLPSYLYFLIYRATNICGEGFLECARLLNVVFYIAAIPLIYRVARLFAGRMASIAVSGFALVLPVNSYIAYFKPEAMFFFVFWVLVWVALASGLARRPLLYGAALGAVLGLLALVKVHGLFLVPGLLLFAVLSVARDQTASRRDVVLVIPAFVLALLLTRLGGGLLAAGGSGLSLLGGFYGAYAESTVSGYQKWLVLATGAAQSLSAHVAGLLLLFGFPLAVLVAALPMALWGRVEDSARRLVMLALLTLGPLVVLAAVFTASVAGAGPYESLSRLHSRYYNFVFPIMAITAAALLGTGGLGNVARNWRAVIAILFGCGAVAGWYMHGTLFQPSFIDSPELRAVGRSPLTKAVTLAASLSCLALWVWRPVVAARVFVFFWAPLFAAAACYFVSAEMRQRMTPDPVDLSGLHLRHQMSSSQRASAVIVGTEPAALFRARFMGDDPKVEILQIPGGATLTPSQLPSDRTLAVVIGDVPTSGFAVERGFGGFAVASTTDERVLSFRRGEQTTHLRRLSGLSVPEEWGTWSLGSRVVFEYQEPLPENVEVTVIAEAFGPNASAEFVMTLGSESKSFRLNGRATLQFVNRQRARVIEIQVPHPMSPRKLGISGDDRQLGMGLKELRISIIRDVQ